MDYSNFDVEDFAADDWFLKWVIDADPGATVFWEDYRRKDPERTVKIDQARAFVLSLYEAEKTPDNPHRAKKLWRSINTEVTLLSLEKRASPRFGFLRVAASVSIVIMFLAAAWYGIKGREAFSADDPVAKADTYKDFIEKINNTGGVIEVRLSDGSIVRMEKNTRLQYRPDYQGEPYREVYLSGEAFFEIAKNPHQPFLVYASDVVTRVLGTSFRVKACADEQNVLVAVKEGKVSVYSAKDQKKSRHIRKAEVKGVVLTSNQQVFYRGAEDSFNKTLVEAPEVVNGNAGQFGFAFEDTPVKDVFNLLEKAYGVELIFDEEVLQNCYLTVPLGEEPLFEKLTIICRTIGATYELIDAKIIISSKGC